MQQCAAVCGRSALSNPGGRGDGGAAGRGPASSPRAHALPHARRMPSAPSAMHQPAAWTPLRGAGAGCPYGPVCGGLSGGPLGRDPPLSSSPSRTTRPGQPSSSSRPSFRALHPGDSPPAPARRPGNAPARSSVCARRRAPQSPAPPRAVVQPLPRPPSPPRGPRLREGTPLCWPVSSQSHQQPRTWQGFGSNLTVVQLCHMARAAFSFW